MALYRVASVLGGIVQVVEQVGPAREQAEGESRQSGAGQYARLAERPGGVGRAKNEQVLRPLVHPHCPRPRLSGPYGMRHRSHCGARPAVDGWVVRCGHPQARRRVCVGHPGDVLRRDAFAC